MQGGVPMSLVVSVSADSVMKRQSSGGASWIISPSCVRFFISVSFAHRAVPTAALHAEADGSRSLTPTRRDEPALTYWSDLAAGGGRFRFSGGVFPGSLLGGAPRAFYQLPGRV